MKYFKLSYKKYKLLPIQARASLWFLICSFLAKGMSALTTPIFTRIMSPAEYGKYGVFNSWQLILSSLITLNMFGGVYVNGLVKFEEDKRHYMSSLQGLCLCLVGGWAVVYLLFFNNINRIVGLNTAAMLCLFVFTWEESVFRAWSVYQRTELKYIKLVILTMIVSIIRPLCGVVFVLLFNGTANARIVSMTLVDVIAYTGLFIVLLLLGRNFYNGYYWKYTLYHNLPLIPHYLSMTLLSNCDRIMISRLVDDSSAGIYNLAYQLANIMYFFHTALMQTIEPWIYKKLKDGKMRDISRMLNITATFMVSLLMVAIAFSPELLQIFAPPQYYDALYVIPPIIMSILFIFLYIFFATFEFYKEKSKLIAIASFFGAFLNIVLNYVFIQKFGYKAAGYTTLI